MAKELTIKPDEELNLKSEKFMKQIDSEMRFQSELTNNSMSFEWISEFEFACPYIDNIVRNPKVALVKEEEVVKIEKAKKTSVASIKDLSRNTHYIEKIDPVTNEVQPAKILISRNEETYNTYENRFVYTLIDNMVKFIGKKEKEFENLETKNDKVLEYSANTNTGVERVNIELKISSNELPKNNDKGFSKELLAAKKKIRAIKDYLKSWKNSEFILSLDRLRVSFVSPPIRKTNVILKNPNFQIAMRMWSFLQTYDLTDDKDTKDSLDTSGDSVVKGILDTAFLLDFFVLDSIDSSKRKQKENITKYAVIMFNQQVQRAISILLNSGIKISDQEILDMVLSRIENEREKRVVGAQDVKNKFKDVMDEYLEKIQDYI